jgi:hypothetical protein
MRRTVTRVAEHPKKWIDAVATGPGGAIAYATGKQAHVWLGDGSTRVFGHERAVGGVAFAPKGMRLGVARYGGISLWWPNTDAGAVMLDWKGSHTSITFRPTDVTVTAMQRMRCMAGGRRRRWAPAHDRHSQAALAVMVGEGRFSQLGARWRCFGPSTQRWPQESRFADRRAKALATRCLPPMMRRSIGYADGAVAIARYPAASADPRAADGPVRRSTGTTAARGLPSAPSRAWRDHRHSGPLKQRNPTTA